MILKRVLRKTARKYREEGFFRALRWLFFCIKIKLRLIKCPNPDYYKIKAEKDLLLKPLPNIFICAGVPYYDIGGGQRSSQLSSALNSMGYAVYYFYAYPSSDPSPQISPLPLCAHHIIEDDTPERIKNIISPDDIFIFESPSPRFDALIDLGVKCRCKIVYESIDNWETSLGSGVFSRETLKKLLSCADVLTATAKPLVRQMKQYLAEYDIVEKPILYLPNAANTELFCPHKSYEVPYDLKHGRVTLLYFGSLWGEWFDWDLLFELAKAHPEYCINLIGDHSAVQDKVRDAPYNIVFLGAKAQSQLPAYLAHADFAIIPFRAGEISDYVSPLKAFEYLAMGKRVLSTSIPDIQDYPNVFIGDSANEWEAFIESSPSAVSYESFSSENSWQSRSLSLLSKLTAENESPLKDNLSIIVLNRNNKGVIFKCLRALEHHKKDMGYEVIVVDNCSTDGSAEMLMDMRGQITFLRNSKNGCSSGRNLGAAHARGKYLLFLDSDQWPTRDGWLSPFETVIKSYPDFGAIGWAAGFFDRFGKAHHVVDSFPLRYMPPNALARSDVGYLGSGGMLISKNVFLSVGGFDISYDPTCYEDTDISLKIRHIGRELYFCPHAGIFHLPHQTTNSGSPDHRHLTLQKQKYFTEKWKAKNPDLLKYIK